MNHHTEWRKSSQQRHRGNCLEIAEVPGSVLVRDTQHWELGHLDFTPRHGLRSQTSAGRL